MSLTGDARVVASTGGKSVYVWVVYALLMVHATCYQLQTPLEPYLVDHLIGKGTSATTTYGYLQSFYWVVQLIGSAAFGGFLDRYGCRTGLIVSNLACATQFTVLANTSSVMLLFFSKVPGILSHPFLSCQTAISRLTPEGPERITAFGRLVTSYTIGGVIGPYVGGRLGADGNFFLSAKIAAVVSFLSALICCALPANMERATEVRAEAPLVDESGRGAAAAEEEPEQLLPWRQRVTTICRVAGPLILMKFLMHTLSGMTKSADTMVMKNELDLTQADLGFIMSCQFAFMSFNSGVLLGPLTRFLGGRARPVVTKCLPVVSALYFLQSWLRSDHHELLDGLSGLTQTYIFVSVTMIGTVFRFSMSTSITAENTRRVPKSIKGTLLGLEHSIGACSRIAAPTFGIKLLDKFGSSRLYSFCAFGPLLICMVWVTFSARWLPDPEPEKVSGEDAKESKEASSTTSATSVEMRKGTRC